MRLFLHDQITKPSCGRGCMGIDIPSRSGVLRRLVRWARTGFARPRPAPIMIAPDPAALAAWRTLLGVVLKDRN